MSRSDRCWQSDPIRATRLVLRIGLAAVALAAALAACAMGSTRRGEMTSPSPARQSWPEPAADTLLLDISFIPPRGNETGLRVYGDGRYEQLTDRELVVGSDYTVTQVAAERAWRPVFTFTPDELAELRQAMRDANLTSLQPRYQPDTVVFDPTTMVWRAWVDGQPVEIVVEGYPTTRVPELDWLFQRLNEIHRWPQSSSVWRVLVDGRVIQRSVDCDVSGVDALRPVIQALFIPEAAPADGSVLPEAAPEAVLLEVTWRENGREIERSLVYGDGRFTKVVDGAESPVRTFTPDELNALRRAIQSVGWESLPDPVCTS